MAKYDHFSDGIDAALREPEASHSGLDHDWQLSGIYAMPLLTKEEEVELSHSIRNDLHSLREVVLRSPLTAKELCSWDELIAMGEMTAKELMPRGRRSREEIRRMRDKIRNLVKLMHKGRARVAKEELYEQISSLELNEKKIQRLANKIKSLAYTLRNARSAGERRRLLKSHPISAEELFSLDERIRTLEESIHEAKTKFIQANMKLVVSIAKKFVSNSLEISDLVQEGALGLMCAAEKFDYTKGFKFSTYATWWIRQSIQRALSDKEQTVRIPVHIRERAARIRKITEGYIWQHGRAPRLPEIARRIHLPAAKVGMIMESMHEPISLSTPIAESEDSDLEGAIEDKTLLSPAEAVQNNFRMEEMDKWLSQLSERETDILKLRFGISIDRPCTLAELGKKFGVSRERVRQIQKNAIAKLKEASANSAVRDYW